jgi:hypothetical protein
LLKSKLTDDEGRSLGTALDLVDQLEAVRGKVPHTRGDAQFRLYVLLRSPAAGRRVGARRSLDGGQLGRPRRNNYARHVNRWSDFMGWWQHLFGLNLSRVPEDIRESVFDEVLPVVARVDGGYPLVVAVEHFFSSWLVQRTPRKAMPYVAEAAYSCVAEYEPGAENLGLAPIRILRHMLDASEAVGRVAHLEDAIDGVPLTDDENLTCPSSKLVLP